VATNKWTTFELPVRDTEIRYISLMERDGKTEVIVPVYRASQMGAAQRGRSRRPQGEGAVSAAGTDVQTAGGSGAARSARRLLDWSTDLENVELCDALAFPAALHLFLDPG
jgi:hypothetical protein